MSEERYSTHDDSDLRRRTRVIGVMVPRLPVTGRVIFGLVVIAIGVIFTLNNFGVVDADEVLAWWPALLVAYGAMRLTGLGSRPHLASGLIFTVIGAWLLLGNLGLVSSSPWGFWPMILILVGASMVLNALGRARDAATSGPEGSGPNLNAFALMSGSDRKIASQEFRGGEATAIMGGHVIDLKQAALAGGEAVIDVFVWWGGIDVIVPPEWTVSCEAVAIMGGVEDNTKPPAGEPRGHLVIKGLVVMGGVEVKN